MGKDVKSLTDKQLVALIDESDEINHEKDAHDEMYARICAATGKTLPLKATAIFSWKKAARES